MPSAILRFTEIGYYANIGISNIAEGIISKSHEV
jgi:hypothetical protein